MTEIIERCATYVRQNAVEVNLVHVLTLAFAEFARAAQEPEMVERLSRAVARREAFQIRTLGAVELADKLEEDWKRWREGVDLLLAALFQTTGVEDAT